MFDEHKLDVNCIQFLQFSGGRYLCSGSSDKTVCLWNVETSKLLTVLSNDIGIVYCLDIAALQSKINNISMIQNKMNINFDIEITKLNRRLFGHRNKSVSLWNLLFCKEIIVFNGHKNLVNAVEYSVFLIKNNNIGNLNGYAIIS
ncbi:WD-repeat protein [Reticulomyxa filosa]|uniref:WD-repeat protein n=1 Tax=Reticulomyxa filosa TaxID=46433 RepID=X6M1A0_RETFI|nr:WD-repeat protein [Reticulomyxa filosa]|eukprot:ETO07903.1 WD-repeat protein [Reticulomyxa filosa]